MINIYGKGEGGWVGGVKWKLTFEIEFGLMMGGPQSLHVYMLCILIYTHTHTYLNGKRELIVKAVLSFTASVAPSGPAETCCLPPLKGVFSTC